MRAYATNTFVKFLPARASEQGNVVGLVSVLYIYTMQGWANEPTVALKCCFFWALKRLLSIFKS